MTQEKLKKLESNLTKSALKAKPGYVRLMLGYGEENQGFGPIEGITIFNTLQDKNTTLAEFLEDVQSLQASHTSLQQAYAQLQQDLEMYKMEKNLKEIEFQANLQALEKRVTDLEKFTLD